MWLRTWLIVGTLLLVALTSLEVFWRTQGHSATVIDDIALWAEQAIDVLDVLEGAGDDVAVLAIEEVGYPTDPRPIWHSRTWFPPSEMSFELVRHRTGASA